MTKIKLLLPFLLVLSLLTIQSTHVTSSNEPVMIEFFFYEPCPTCPVTQAQYEIYLHNSELVDDIGEEYTSNVTVERIYFYSTEGLEKIGQYGVGIEDWNTIVISYEKIILGHANGSYVREIIDAYLLGTAHDISITKVALSEPTIEIGEQVNITVRLKNNGIVSENVTVNTYINGTLIETQFITNISPNAELPIVFSWDTTNQTVGNYILRIEAEDVDGENNLFNNVYVNDKIEIVKAVNLPTTLLLAFSFGFFETFSPCLLVLLSFVLSYTLGQTPQFKDNFLKIQSFGLGFIAATLLLALAFGMFFLSMPSLQYVLTWGVSIFAIVFGLNLLGVLKLPSKLTFDSKSTVKKFAGIFFMMDNIFIGLFFLGFIFYFLDPCIAPIFIAMIPLLLHEHLGLIILVFSIGAFIPFIGIGLLVGSISRLVSFTNEHRSKIRAVSGIILISYAIYLIIFNLLS